MFYYLGKHSGTAKASGKWFGFICGLTSNRWKQPEVRKFFIDSPVLYDTIAFELGAPLSCSFDCDGRLVTCAPADGDPLVLPDELLNELFS